MRVVLVGPLDAVGVARLQRRPIAFEDAARVGHHVTVGLVRLPQRRPAKVRVVVDAAARQLALFPIRTNEPRHSVKHEQRPRGRHL